MHIKFPPIPSDAAKDFNGNIIIIGAGVAGLFAANTLKYMGVDNYVILEATDRIGGRLKRCDDLHDNVPLDVGAEWIHHKDEQMVKDMLKIFKHHDDDDDNLDDLLPKSDFIKYQPEFTLQSGGKSRLLTSMYQETKWKRSTWWDWLHTHVYSHVQEKVKLHSPVTEIIYGTAAKNNTTTTGKRVVKVIMADGTEYEADKVICTIPLGVLKKGDAMLKFNPPLPIKTRQAIDAIDMPPGFRILFEMKTKFYPDLKLGNGLMEIAWTMGDLTCAYDALYGKELSDTEPQQQHVLAFVAIGNKNAGEMGKMEEKDLVKAALAKIDEMFDGQGSQNYIRHVVQNWTLEPYILGSYSFSGPRKHRQQVGETLEHQVLFAGEHTSVDYFSLVPGAALEGRRAAIEAVSDFK